MSPPMSAAVHDDDLTNSQNYDAMNPPTLPSLTEKPMAYSGCCLALSVPLVTHIHALFPPPPALVLSIGSGFGLLEAHLLTVQPSPRLVGVEVSPSPNHYLPAINLHTVHGTRFLEPLAGEATTWLFVYPRRVGLISEYMDEYSNGSVEQIIWIGPQADWDDYKGCFTGWTVQTQNADVVGGRAWDMIAVAKKPT